MKGFPNQIADLQKIARAMRVFAQLLDSGRDAADDGVFGEALVQAGVIGTGHARQGQPPVTVEQYLKVQRAKKPGNQSFRTTARGLRELFRLLRLIDDSGHAPTVTDNGRQAASFGNAPLNEESVAFWRRVIPAMMHGSNGAYSHPYQVLLNLVKMCPGISRAKCALALEARDDSAEELDRIVRLAKLPEEKIRERLGVSKPNWDNAKKVLPKFAEQLKDVVKDRESFTIAAAPGLANSGEPRAGASAKVNRRTPRGSREVDHNSIASAGSLEKLNEGQNPSSLDPAAAQQAIARRLDRLRRHNAVVRLLAGALAPARPQMFEDPFDLLANFDAGTLLVEVKSLDGTTADERDRVQEALAQLLYYQAFLSVPLADGSAILKIACFERAISAEHQQWLEGFGVCAIWLNMQGQFCGTELARRLLRPYIDLR